MLRDTRAFIVSTCFGVTFAGAVALATSGWAQSAGPLKVGVLMPTSGLFAPIGIEQINGMQIAIDEFNGVVAGRKVELIVEDTEGRPATGLTKARKLVTSDKVDVLAGIVSSAVALAVGPFVAKERIPLVISNAGTDLLSGEKCERFVIRASYSVSQYSIPIGEWMAKNGKKRVFILASDYVAPREVVEGFRKAYVASGGTIVGEAYPPFGKTQDYGPYIAQARATNPDAIFGIFYGTEAILFVKQYDAFGMRDKIPLFSGIGITPPNLRDAQGASAAGVISSANYVPELDTPENKKFVAAYTAKFKTGPGEFAAYGYDTMRVILEGAKALNGDTADKAAYVTAMEKIAFTGPRGPIKLSSTDRGITQHIYIVKTVLKGNEVVFEILDTIRNVADPVTGCKLN